jgi:hypothetical protein
MDIKQKIELLLERLKNAGIDRRTIEKALDYSENYIDQILSRGPYEKFLGKLELYAQSILPQDQQPSEFTEPFEHELRKKWTSEIDVSRLINVLLEEKDRAIKKAEEYAKKKESLYEDVKADKAHLLSQLNKLQDLVDNTLKQLAENLKETTATVVQINQQLAQLNDQTHQKKLPSTQQDSKKKNKDL